MSRRMDIELTSNRGDGTWTWRAAGAREPRGVLDGALLPAGTKPSDVLRAEVETDLDGSTVTTVLPTKQRNDPAGLIALLPTERPFEAVTTKLKKDRPGRGRSDRDARPRKPREGEATKGRRDETSERRGEARRPARPRFETPPEIPMRPRPKRLKAGRMHVDAILSGLGEAERVIAERVVAGGIPAVRKAATEHNETALKSGLAPVPVDSVVAIAEKLQPRLRVAEWRDRAEAVRDGAADIDLRDLRSVVAAADDPLIARDETTRALATELKAILVRRQDEETRLWLDDITAATEIGRIVRALKLSSQPPKAGLRLPADLAARLAETTTAALTADAPAERWTIVLEAAAFSPVHLVVKPPAAPVQITEDLTKTVKRLAPLLPEIGRLFGIDVDPKAAMPRPLRPQRPAAKGERRPDRKPRGPRAGRASASNTAAAPTE